MVFDQYRLPACPGLSWTPIQEPRSGVGIVDGVPGQMHLPDHISREPLEVRDRILVEVLARHVDVVHIAQEATARAMYDGGEELWLRYGGARKAQIARRILDQETTTEHRLRLIDIAADDVERLLGVYQRQQMVEIGAAGHTPCQVL